MACVYYNLEYDIYDHDYVYDMTMWWRLNFRSYLIMKVEMYLRSFVLYTTACEVHNNRRTTIICAQVQPEKVLTVLLTCLTNV